MIHAPKVILPESRVPVYAASMSAALLHFALPKEVVAVPVWVPVAIIVPLVLPQIVLRVCGNSRLARRLGTVSLCALTLFLVGALGALIVRLLTQPSSHHEATLILRAAVPLWLANVVVFGLWYWRLDAGGPHVRERSHAIAHGFVFPQMTMDEELRNHLCQAHWRPMFLDYLFVAFNTSTAFSPTDTAVIGGWAKAMTMLQTLISLSLLVVVAARAVNIL